MTKKIFICFLLIISQSISQEKYEIIRYFNSLTNCSDTNAYMEDLNCVYVKIEFPIFLDDTNNSLNEIIKIFIFRNYFEKPYNNFDVYAKEFFQDYLETQLEFKTPEWGYTVYVDTMIISKKIIAISFGSYKYMGGAHGVYKLVTLNYEKETGKVLDMDNMFVLNYESNLNDIMNKLVKDKTQKIDFFDYNNYYYGSINTRFLIGEKDLIVKFDWYDETYRSGAGEKVAVPFSLMKSIINPEYKFLINQ